MKHVAVGVLVALLGSSAMACSSLRRPTNDELFDEAHSVFRARVTEVKLTKLAEPTEPGGQVEVVEASYEVKEIFKGTPPASGVVRDLPFGVGNCSLGLLPGMEYVFFPREKDFVLLLSGSFGFVNAEGNEVKQRLEQLRQRAAAGRQ